MYVVDSTNRYIRKFTYVAPNWIEQTTLIGSVQQPFAGTTNQAGYADGSRGTATFYALCGIAIDTNNIIYVADTIMHTIRRIDTNGNVTTIAGNAGSGTNVGDTNGSSARFKHPNGITIDNQSRLYIADSGNSCIKQVTTTSPYYTATIHCGTNVTYYAMACDGINVYAATRTSIIKLVPPSSGTTWIESSITYASTQGTYITAMIWRGDRLLVFDSNAIYKVSPTISKTMILGNNTEGSSDGPISTSTSNFKTLIFGVDNPGLNALTFDNNNNLYINDYMNNQFNSDSPYCRIRMIRPYIECA
jgi:sugar lactone lactonase YvrE